MDEITKKVAEEASGVLKEVYKDALSPSVQSVGVMLSYPPRSLRLAFSRWEKWIVNGEESIKLTGELLREKVSKIPEQKLCEPELYVAIPAIQQLSYCQDNESLRDMYANLLASSMNIDTKWKVHPAFVDIIKQLTPDEAKLLKKLPANIMILHPLIDVKMRKTPEGGSHTLISNFTTFGMDVIENKGNIGSYIENLERLKIIEIPALSSISNKEVYEDLKNSQMIKNNIHSSILEHFTIDYNYKLFNVTNFGVKLIETCCN